MTTSNKIYFWPHIDKKIGRNEITIQDWLEMIKNTPENYLQLINSSRMIYDQFGKCDSYNALKKLLPSAQLNGSFPNRDNSSCESVTGYAYLDTDRCDMEATKLILESSEYVYSYWKSVSGRGYGILVRYEAEVQDFNEVLVEIAKEIGIDLDENAKGISRPNYLSNDPNIYINEKAKVFLFEKKCKPNIIYPLQPVFILGLHFSESYNDTNRLQFETQLESYPTTVVFKEEQYFKAFWPFQSFGKPKHIYEGERNSTLSAFINNLRILNPNKRNGVLNIARSYNKSYCHPALPETELEKMISYAYSKPCQPIGVRTKKIWVNPDCKNKKEAIGKAKSQSNQDKINDYLAEAFCDNKKITITSIAKATGLSRPTIYKYFTYYESDIKDFNQALK